MSVLTDLVVADLGQAGALARTLKPSSDWNCLDVKGIDIVKLCRLRAILTNAPYRKAWIAEFRYLAGDEDFGPWVMAVPDALVAGLAAMPEEALSPVASRWHATEEFRLERWRLADVEASLKDIHRLAKTAVAANKPVLLWISL